MNDLLSCNIIEKDDNDDIIWTWTYPSISDKEKQLILSRCSKLPHNFCFGRLFMKWFYIYYVEVNEAPSLPNVKEFACVLWSKDFNPEKYEKLCHLMSKTYLDSGNTVNVLQLYLSVIMKGAFVTKDNGTFLVKEFSPGSFSRNTKVKDLIKLFGLESILIYTAILLKKKLVLYHHSLSTLLEWIPTFCSLISHRNVSQYLFPWLELTKDELEQLKITASYIAGFCDNGILSRSDLYEVMVNLPAREISVSPEVKESLAMTKIHKDIALFMVQLSEGEGSENKVIKALEDKTNELLDQLRILGKEMDDGKFFVPVESLKDKKMSPAMNTFFFQLALAENVLLL